MEYVIETKGLTKRYGGAIAMDNVCIHVPRGKIYALLGRNGAGKTTFMKTILHLIRATSGSVYLFGEKNHKPDGKVFGKIGSIIEMPGFYENLSAHENLSLIMRLRGDLNKEGVEEALDAVGLLGEHNKPFSDYSLGMKQRLGIAAAMMHNPALLILDEPTNGLDPIGIAGIRTLLESLSREKGITILISSHVLSEIEQIADVIGVMHQGRLIEEIDMTELRKHNRRYLEFEVSDTSSATDLLGKIHDITNCQIQGNTLKVFDATCSSGAINRTFVENQITVTKVYEEKENLENYFSQLIGGGGIA